MKPSQITEPGTYLYRMPAWEESVIVEIVKGEKLYCLIGEEYCPMLVEDLPDEAILERQEAPTPKVKE